MHRVRQQLAAVLSSHGPRVTMSNLGGPARLFLCAVVAAAGGIGRAGAAPASQEPLDPVAAGELPQYIFFNRSPSGGDTARWHQSRPERFTPASCREIVETIGTPGHERLRVGVHFPFSILEGDLETVAKSLSRLLGSAEEADVPVLVTLDGQNWWQSRPDLWNWWDPELPGFDPANRLNVEWCGWGPEHAVKIGWRNWGHQIRVRPAPNIASPQVLAEHWQAYDVLVPIIVQWQRRLPDDRKYLFGGVKVGWEASINVNAYYYEDGNRIFEAHPDDASGDPQARDPDKGWTFGHAVLGYAAVSTSGIKRSGELTRGDIEQVVHEYLARLCREARRRGLPPHMLFTHQGGTMPPWERHLSFRPAINDDAVPGWSFYWKTPQECGTLERDLDTSERRQWAASEWWLGAGDQEGWLRNFRETLAFEQCRFICVYNWGPFCKDGNAVAAVRQLLDETRPSAATPSATAPSATDKRP